MKLGWKSAQFGKNALQVYTEAHAHSVWTDEFRPLVTSRGLPYFLIAENNYTF